MSIDGVLPEVSSVGGKETWIQINRARLRAYVGVGMIKFVRKQEYAPVMISFRMLSDLRNNDHKKFFGANR
jgi:hypothetical protein